MSYYHKKQQEVKQENNLSSKEYLNDFEAAEYTGLSRTGFRKWAEQIGCRRKIGRRAVNIRSIIDEAILNDKCD